MRPDPGDPNNNPRIQQQVFQPKIGARLAIVLTVVGLAITALAAYASLILLDQLVRDGLL